MGSPTLIFPSKILISRTDSIGDVVLTLPLCAFIKKHSPQTKIVFLGAKYTVPILDACPAIDEVWDWKELEAKEEKVRSEFLQAAQLDAVLHVFPRKEIAKWTKTAKIPLRIGTSHRSFHLFTCNKRVSFTRKNAQESEAQLNFHLLRPFGLKILPTLSELNQEAVIERPKIDLPLPLATKKKVVLHAKSQGSAVEWPLEKYTELTHRLIASGYTVYWTGTEKEGEQIRSAIPIDENCVDTTGKLTLTELMVLISEMDALVACSTGPLHIAGALGTKAIGLFSPRRPIHPGRWQPLGVKSRTITSRDFCPCKSKEACKCIDVIDVDTVMNAVLA